MKSGKAADFDYAKQLKLRENDYANAETPTNPVNNAKERPFCANCTKSRRKITTRMQNVPFLARKRAKKAILLCEMHKKRMFQCILRP